MPLQRSNNAPHDQRQRCFGLRIESKALHLAIARPLPDGRYELDIDHVTCSSPEGWLNPAHSQRLHEAIATLTERHEIRHERIAVSLDGDFCVTRIAMGTTERVDQELSMLEVRVPRYLQLGPGEKVTGNARSTIAPAVDYAVTGVVNRSLIQLIYEALRANDWKVTWVEPSLVSVARLLGQARVGEDRPVMIADGTGSQWDVGIACAGRLLLDYRPASATSAAGLRDAVDGHLSRLQRFCQRHRGIASGELGELLICGSDQNSQHAEEALQDSVAIQAAMMTVPDLPELYQIDDRHRGPAVVAPVATVLPLLIDVPASEVPDLLEDVRREPDQPLVSRVLRTGWPLIAASLVLSVSYGLVTGQRYRHAGSIAGRATMQAQIDANEVRFSELSRKRNLVTQLAKIREQTVEPRWHQLFERITQSLPNTAKLNDFQVETGGAVLLNGTVTDEPVVFELVNELRRLPGVAQVALRGTTPDDSVQGVRFMIGLMTADSNRATELGTHHE